MGDSYTVTVYFASKPTLKQQQEAQENILRALYEDDQTENHCEPMTFEEFKENSDVWFEWEDSGTTLTATFRGWYCCYSAARKVARQLTQKYN